MRKHSGTLIASCLLVTACGGQPAAGPAIVTVTQTPSTTTTTTTEKIASAGDVAACKGYMRMEPHANKNLKDIGKGGTPVFIIELSFKMIVEDLEENTVAATDPELTSAFAAAEAAAKSARATTKAYQKGHSGLDP